MYWQSLLKAIYSFQQQTKEKTAYEEIHRNHIKKRRYQHQQKSEPLWLAFLFMK